ncbi:MAG: ribose-5-phosphate isomerase RpiA [Planctomycetota bacterium]
MPESQEKAKQNAAIAGAAMVLHGMTVGLGSGTTAELLVAELGRRVRHYGLMITAVSTSERTSDLAKLAGIQIVDPAEIKTLDIVIDGADEIDPQFRMIKGRGGALLREKIVAAAGHKRVILVDQTKPVLQLGTRHHLPVEIAAFGQHWTLSQLHKIVQKVTLRTLPNGMPFITDGGNRIADLHTGPIPNPESLHATLLAIPGVYETGLFIDLCDVLIVANSTNVQISNRPKPA